MTRPPHPDIQLHRDIATLASGIVILTEAVMIGQGLDNIDPTILQRLNDARDLAGDVAERHDR